MSRLLLLSLGLLATLTPGALAQAKEAKPGDPKEESVETADGVSIRCRFYAAGKEGNGSVVILMHDYNADPNAGDWDGLARFLTRDVGVHVMRFDFRGHGDSKTISTPKKFWGETWNQQKVSGYMHRPEKTTIEMKDFYRDYYPMLVNDLAAVRNVIDIKNDNRAVNARTVYIIASGSAAPLAFLFLAEEWSRQQTKPEPKGFNVSIPEIVYANGRRLPNTEVAGKDYAGLILLSPTRTYTYERGNEKGKSTVSSQWLRDWVNRYAKDYQAGGDLRSTISCLTLVGEKDTAGVKDASYFYNDLLDADGKSSRQKMKNSSLFTIKGAKEKGVELLGKNNTLKTEDLIKAYLLKIEDERKRLNQTDRNYNRPFRINLGSFGVSN